MLNKTKQIYLFFFTSVLLSACGHKKVDVSNIDVNVKIGRFDREFDAMKNRPMAQQAAYLQNKYGRFYHDFIATLLQDNQINTTTDTAYFSLLRQVFATKDYHDMKHDIDSVYPNLDKPEADLTDAFRHIKYYYPDEKLPALYAFASGFETPIITDNGLYGIGLDLFLGGNSRFYPALTSAWPRYMSRNFNEQNICPRVVEGMVREDMFPESDSSKTLMSKMIYNGKIMYFMDQVMPDEPDTLKIGYTGAQLKWCQQFESKIWAWFIDQNLMYETDYPKIQKYLSVAPFTPGLGEKNESAPKLGVWTGWQIVKRYMEKHPDVTLQQLMAGNDAQKILNEANYHPK